MKAIIKRDLKNLLPLVGGYLVLQYLCIFAIEEVGLLLGDGTLPFALEYFYYFLIVVSVIFLTVGSLLLFIYIIINPAIKDVEVKKSLNENIVLYRLFIITFLFFLGLFNFFLGLAAITGFDLHILFNQSLQLYIGLSFGIQGVLSIILIAYNKVYNNKFFTSKLNIMFNLIILILIYTSGNLYYFYYFQYGMLLLIANYIFMYLNIKIIVGNTFTNKISKIIWSLLIVTFIGLLVLVGFKGKNINKEDYYDSSYEDQKFEQTQVYNFKTIDSDKYGQVNIYSLNKENTKYQFTLNNKLYLLENYTKDYTDTNITMRSLNNLEQVNIFGEGDGYYLESSILQTDNESTQEYLSCSGQYTENEIITNACLDNDTKFVIQNVSSLID